MDESTIQSALYREMSQKGHSYIIPNIYLGYEESDLISVTKAGYINEYEIKLTRSDFRADFKKHKHNRLKNNLKQWRSCFWFVAPVGLIKLGEIPDYAGHIEVRERRAGSLRQIICFERKRAKRFKAKKLSGYQKAQICNSLMIRFWKAQKRIHRQMQMKLF